MTVRPCVRAPLFCALLALSLGACRGSGTTNQNGSASADGTTAGSTTSGSTTAADSGSDGAAAPGGVATAATSVGFLGGNGNNYRLVGRFDVTNPNAVRMSTLSAKIGATFTGNTLSVMLSDTGYNMYNVAIDGVPQTVLATSPNAIPQTYSIASGLGSGAHTVWMTKRTEPYQSDKLTPSKVSGTTTFYGFTLAGDGAFQTPPLAKSRLIEFLGDSSCTGYGVDQLVAAGATTCPFTLATQNGDASLPAFAALAADAEIVNVSASGRGIYTSQYDQNDLTNQLPYLYRETVPPAASSVYAFDQYVPHVVVVNGGGDDVFGDAGNGNFPAPAEFITAYTDLVTSIRGHYPNALIICAVGSGTFGNDKILITGAINQVVAARVAAGDTNITIFDYFTGSPNGWSTYGDAGVTLGYGCEGHSSTAGSKFLGGQLGAFIKTKLNWQ